MPQVRSGLYFYTIKIFFKELFEYAQPESSECCRRLALAVETEISFNSQLCLCLASVFALCTFCVTKGYRSSFDEFLSVGVC